MSLKTLYLGNCWGMGHDDSTPQYSVLKDSSAVLHGSTQSSGCDEWSSPEPWAGCTPQFFLSGSHCGGVNHSHLQPHLGSFSLGINSPARLQNGIGSNSGPTRPRLRLQEKAQSDAF